MPKRSLSPLSSPAKSRPIHWQEIEPAFKSKNFLGVLSKLPPILPFSYCQAILYNMQVNVKFQDQVNVKAQDRESYYKPLNEIFNRVLSRLNEGILNEPETEQWLTGSKDLAKELSCTLYNLGSLAHIKKQQLAWEAKLSSLQVNIVLTKLQSCKLNSKNISLSLLGVGRLAKARQLEGKINLENISDLLERLKQYRYRDLLPQNISSALHGLGELVEAGMLDGKVDSNTVYALLARLNEFRKIDPQAISNGLLGLGRLAEAGQLEGKIRCKDIPLKPLSQLDNTGAQAIGNSLQGIGQLAEAGHLEGMIDGQVVSVLLEKLNIVKPLLPQNIGISLCGLGRLAEAGQLDGKIDERVLSALLKCLIECDELSPQAISTSLYGLGRLAEAGQLVGTLNSQVLSALLRRLNECDNVSPQAISNSLHALGRLADSGQISGKLDSKAIYALLQKLNRCKDIDPSAIGSSLHSLRRLAELGQLEGKPGRGILSALLGTLKDNKDFDPKAISGSLYSLGWLAISGHLDDEIDSRLSSTLLEKLAKCSDLDPQAISNCFCGLGHLKRLGKLSGDVSSSAIQALINRFIHLSPKSFDVYFGLYGLSALVPQGIEAQALIGQKSLEILMEFILRDSYLHPTEAAELIHAFACFKQQSPRLDQVFQILLGALSSISLQRLPQRLRTQLKEDKVLLAFAPQWKLGLQSYIEPPVSSPPSPLLPPPDCSSPKPADVQNQESELLTASTETRHVVSQSPVVVPPPRHQQVSDWDTACRNNVLFKAIARNNIRELERILKEDGGHVSAADSQERTSQSSKGTGTHRHVAKGRRLEPHSAEKRVCEFFQQTSATALRELIAGSQAKYFVLLLNASSLHGRYQLAKHYDLHLLLIHLPGNQLNELIDKLISPLQFYRDHRALLALVDGLTIRIDQSGPDNRVVNLQKRLIDEGLRFHRLCQHHCVVTQLEAVAIRMTQPIMTLEDVAGARVETQLAAPTVPLPPNNRRAQPQPRQAPLAVVAGRVEARRSATNLVPAARINNSYNYTAKDIDALLLARLSSQPSIKILGAASLLPNGLYEQPVDILKSFFDKTAGLATILLPIAVNKHWIGLKLYSQQGKITKAVYFNSLDEGAEQYRKAIVAQLKEANLLSPKTQFFRNDNELKQSDSHACGVFLVENMVCDITQEKWVSAKSTHQPPDLVCKIRAYHLRLMNKVNPEHYTIFAQQNNEMTASVSEQLPHATHPNRFFSNTNRLSEAPSSPSFSNSR